MSSTGPAHRDGKLVLRKKLIYLWRENRDRLSNGRFWTSGMILDVGRHVVDFSIHGHPTVIGSVMFSDLGKTVWLDWSTLKP